MRVDVVACNGHPGQPDPSRQALCRQPDQSRQASCRQPDPRRLGDRNTMCSVEDAVLLVMVLLYSPYHHSGLLPQIMSSGKVD